MARLSRTTYRGLSLRVVQQRLSLDYCSFQEEREMAPSGEAYS